MFTPKTTLDHELRVKVACQRALPEGWPTDAAYSVHTEFRFKNWRNMPDQDNCHKLCLDALNPKRYRKKLVEAPFVWEDDVQVSKGSYERIVTGDEESTIVTIRVVSD